MKTKISIGLILFLLLPLLSCDKDDSEYSIEDEINAIRPILEIDTYANGLHVDEGFDDAYAENGFLIINYGNSISRINLNNADKIEILPKLSEHIYNNFLLME